MYLFTFVLLSLSANTQGAFGKINEKYGQLWEEWHKRDVEPKLAGLVGRGKRVYLSSENSKSKNLQGPGLPQSRCLPDSLGRAWVVLRNWGEGLCFWGAERCMGYGGGDWKGGRAGMAQLGAGWKFGKLS